MKNSWIVAPLVLAVASMNGCGGGSSNSVTNAPTAKTVTGLAKHLNGYGQILTGMAFSMFSSGSRPTHRPAYTNDYYSNALGLWVHVSSSPTTFSESFFTDQAETQPAGGVTTTFDLPTQTFTGQISVSKGRFAGLKGTYSQTITITSATGKYSFTLADGTVVDCQFNVSTLSSSWIVGGTATETVTVPTGYSESARAVYNPDGSFQISGSDNNGYGSVLDFSPDLSGKGRISGPDPGLPIQLSWDAKGSAKATFANGLTVTFSNWQFPQG